MDRKWSFTGHEKRCWLNERWNLNAGKQQEREKQFWKKILPIENRANKQDEYQFNRKKGWVNRTLKSQVDERWERIERNAIQTNDEGRCSLRMSQSVTCRNWLMVVTFNWKIEGNESGKKETTNRGGVTILGKRYLIERKNDAEVKYETL